MIRREFKQVTISKKGEKTILLNHPWIYEGEIIKEDDNITNGEIVDVINEKGKYLGSGFLNHHSKIRVRLLGNNPNEKYDQSFFKRRLVYAYEYRKSVMPNDLNAFRVVFGEADALPGLTVDKFNDVLVMQILSLGIELHKEEIVNSLLEIFENDHIKIRGVYERNDVNIREKEGLTENKGWYKLNGSDETTTIIEENGIKYLVDFENGQKTGFFLDQKYNRILVKNISKNKSILDCCTHTGSFALNAYVGGAKKVVALDISEKALTDTKYNATLNDIKLDTICGDVFDVLEKMVKEKNKDYDMIILDPPAFTKSRKSINNAIKGYTELNYLAMKCLKRGDFLVTASCSHFATEELFKMAIHDAAIKANVTLKQVISSGPAPDHPEILGIPETRYLFFLIYQIN